MKMKLSIWKDGKCKDYYPRTKRRAYNLITYHSNGEKYFFRIEYSRQKTLDGEWATLKNEYTCKDAQEMREMISAFTEDFLIKMLT